jgi:transposase
MAGGMRWLHHEFHKGARGRKAKLDNAQQQELKQWVIEGPQAHGFDTGVWNSALINELLWRRFGVSYHARYLCSLLNKLGLSYQKAGFITDRIDEEAYEQQRQAWLSTQWPAILKQAQATNAVILFGDEVSFAMWGSLSRTWAPRGQQPLVKTKGIRKGLKMYGVIEFAGGGFHYRESLHYVLKPKSFKELKQAGIPAEVLSQLKPLKDNEFRTLGSFATALEQALGKELSARHHSPILKHAETAGRFNQEGYVAFLTEVMAHFKGNIILVEDGAPYHKAASVHEFVANHAERLTVERLPAFSPDFNPIEKLWKNTKRDATHLKYFVTFEALREAVCSAFKTYLREATHIIRVMDKLRREAGYDFKPVNH